MRALALTWRGAWQEAWANRRGFWTQVTVMIVNDIVWIIFWVLFFQSVGTIRGWDVDQVLVLLAVLTTAAGVVLGLFNNARRLGELAATGGLDAALALPTPTLLHLLMIAVRIFLLKALQTVLPVVLQLIGSTFIGFGIVFLKIGKFFF